MEALNCPQHGAHEQRFKSIEKTLDDYHKNQAEIVKGQNTLAQRVTATEQSARSAHHRLDSQEEQTRAIYALAFEVKSVSEKQSDILAILTNHNERLEKVEEAPGKTAIKAWQWLLVAMAGGFVGMIFTLGTEMAKKIITGE